VKVSSRGSLFIGAAATNADGGTSVELDDEDDAADVVGGSNAELDDEDDAGARLDDNLELSNSSELTTRAGIGMSLMIVASLIVSHMGLALDDIYSL